MHAAFKVGIVVLSLSAAPLVAEAGTVEGAGIGAGAGAVIAGPPGAVVGGAIGAAVGGPNIFTGRRHYVRSHRRCWRDGRGYRHCARR
jgi:osmotically inducible lipoprotein OsmB